MDSGHFEIDAKAKEGHKRRQYEPVPVSKELNERKSRKLYIAARL